MPVFLAGAAYFSAFDSKAQKNTNIEDNKVIDAPLLSPSVETINSVILTYFPPNNEDGKGNTGVTIDKNPEKGDSASLNKQPIGFLNVSLTASRLDDSYYSRHQIFPSKRKLKLPPDDSLVNLVDNVFYRLNEGKEVTDNALEGWFNKGIFNLDNDRKIFFSDLPAGGFYLYRNKQSGFALGLVYDVGGSWGVGRGNREERRGINRKRNATEEIFNVEEDPNLPSFGGAGIVGRIRF